MNIKQELSIEQQTNRQVKGWDIFSQNLIEQINEREYLIKNEYIVEELTMEGDLNPSYICSCQDFQMRGVVCKHIIGVTFYQLSIRNGA